MAQFWHCLRLTRGYRGLSSHIALSTSPMRTLQHQSLPVPDTFHFHRCSSGSIDQLGLQKY